MRFGRVLPMLLRSTSRYRALFEADGIRLHFSQAALGAIAQVRADTRRAAPPGATPRHPSLPRHFPPLSVTPSVIAAHVLRVAPQRARAADTGARGLRSMMEEVRRCVRRCLHRATCTAPFAPRRLPLLRHLLHSMHAPLKQALLKSMYVHTHRVSHAHSQVLLESMYHLPSWSARGVRHCLVTEDTVLQGKMSELYPHPQVPSSSPERRPFHVASLTATCHAQDETADEPEEPPAAAMG